VFLPTIIPFHLFNKAARLLKVSYGPFETNRLVTPAGILPPGSIVKV
jgi:hypothetical protein